MEEKKWAEGKEESLRYSIHQYSSFSATYHPQNVLDNLPSCQSSRWTTTSTHNQFLLLKLDKLSIPRKITFGKFHKPFMLLREFIVYGGMDQNSLKELLHSGLRNDSEPETFSLHSLLSNSIEMPCKYIKLVPISNWKPSINFTIWSIQLTGISDKQYVHSAKLAFNHYKEKEAMRICLKFLRQNRHYEVFNELLCSSSIQLEDPMITEFHDQLVINGNFKRCEEILDHSFDRNLFAEFISHSKYTPFWRKINPPSPPPHSHHLPSHHPIITKRHLSSSSSSRLWPGMRGGHQMCIDTEGEGVVYLFGGWNGKKELADFWKYDIAAKQWFLISENTSLDNGPGPRSCHKICFDSSKKIIYTLGRYIDTDEIDSAGKITSDFYCYHIEGNYWQLISPNTHAENGPHLLYDHQMCIDEEDQIIYVFGGRTITSNSQNSYSGLFSFHIPSSTWSLLLSDDLIATQSSPSIIRNIDANVNNNNNNDDDEKQNINKNNEEEKQMMHIKARIGHSMLFYAPKKQLIIFAGQRYKYFLSDFYIYDIKERRVTEISRDTSKQGGPDAGFTQRATIDIDSNELFVLSGLRKEQGSNAETVTNSFYCFNLQTQLWQCVYQNDNLDSSYWEEMKDKEPRPRYAHQVVYHPLSREHYLFGGNPGETTNPTLRLDDFWILKLKRITNEEILRKAKFALRKQQLLEMCMKGDSMQALAYLQTHIYEVVDHNDEESSKEFRKLATIVCQQPKLSSENEIFEKRTSLCNQLLQFYPTHMREPLFNLTDFVIY